MFAPRQVFGEFDAEIVRGVDCVERVFMEVVFGGRRLLHAGDRQLDALVGMECHVPLDLPFIQQVEILL